MEKPETSTTNDKWAVFRIDDNGNQFLIREGLSLKEANQVVQEFEARGHKQVYWAEREVG